MARLSTSLCSWERYNHMRGVSKVLGELELISPRKQALALFLQSIQFHCPTPECCRSSLLSSLPGREVHSHSQHLGFNSDSERFVLRCFRHKIYSNRSFPSGPWSSIRTADFTSCWKEKFLAKTQIIDSQTHTGSVMEEENTCSRILVRLFGRQSQSVWWNNVC